MDFVAVAGWRLDSVEGVYVRLGDVVYIGCYHFMLFVWCLKFQGLHLGYEVVFEVIAVDVDWIVGAIFVFACSDFYLQLFEMC